MYYTDPVFSLEFLVFILLEYQNIYCPLEVIMPSPKALICILDKSFWQKTFSLTAYTDLLLLPMFQNVL